VSLLGQNTAVPQQYAPEVLDPIARQTGRAALGLEESQLPFSGEDIWHAWELSWLDRAGVPHAGVGRLSVPASSPNLIESKSLKLYLNSLNSCEFGSREALVDTLQADLSAVAGAPVGVEVLSLDSPALHLSKLPGTNIDSLGDGLAAAEEPDRQVLRGEAAAGKQFLYSHLLRSLCPVTAQPDWATLIVQSRGVQIEPRSLLQYITGFRHHQGFHEQCVERIYQDIALQLAPGELSVYALYTRRGGLDINPWRSSEPSSAPRLRSARQ
jgi:7-cyano-7-deazaguanine reductase